MMDVHKQRKAEQEALRRAEETASDHKYKILADATPVIVFTVHPQDGIVYANNTWFNYSGCTKEETYGFEYITRIHPEDRDVFLAALKHDPLGPPPQSTEARLLDKNNEYNWHLVLLNVIGNAIKFTDQGEVFTRCSQLIVDGEVFLRVEVIDTGRGFTTEDEHRMFKPFSQLKSMPQNTSSGTGLGLVISRQLIQLHGGNLTCKGEKDKGSTFVFTCKVKIPTDDDGPSPEDMNKAVNVSPGEIVMSPSENHEDLDILIICSLKYAAMSIVHHIRKTVADPETCRCTVTKDMNKLLESSEENVASERWTHVIINVVNVNEAVEATNKVIELMTENSQKRPRRKPVEIVLLSTPLQRPEILAGIKQEHQNQAKITILYKPLKPSRYSLVFDPSKEREASQDMKMEIAQRVLENQKDIFKTIGTLARTKKHRVLLAEDNLINQKVMGKFFGKSGLDCDIATDGEDCTNKLFARESGYYDLILVSLLFF
ncbi:hypothetical protein D0Z00_002798 [Geotrichum galactomycetum]|uniref:Uncharacterized protein n=1 Tax=Geotrichum galactomycetum TaxID=27317 RepID=A0ACB6V328_9ASCO|nr:hypothetical protein D0Z00_002798 [Geotrichum candidum]